ncbi:MAG TPA: acyltransferase family protein, partial [Gemmatimonadaceae bacterium]|nr:acyltransferase family protein [Gemmatimonadaceae bacterium]
METRSTRNGVVDRAVGPGATLTDRAFRGDIEGLRAVAILLVVLYHAGWSAMSAGYFGVDVFFVLSGYLITGILIAEIANTGELSLVHFWARRARRLLPAATVVVIAVLVVDAIVVSPFEQIVYAHSARAFAVYASNVLFALRGVNYFAPDLAHNPLVHTWSLSVEEQYYLVFAPFLLLLVRWHVLARDVPIHRRLNRIVVVLSVASFAGCLVTMRWNSVVAFYSLPSRAWEFGFGAFVAINAKHDAAPSDWQRDAVSVVALAGLVLVCAMASDASAHPGWVTLLPAGLTAILIATGRNGTATVVARHLSARPLRLIGRLSYSWYLWHWPMLIWLGSVVSMPSLGLRLCCAFGALVPAAITYRWIESPIRFSPRLRRLPVQTVAAALVVAGLTLASSAFAARHARQTLGDPRLAAAVEAATNLAPVFTDGCNLDIKVIKLPSCSFANAASDTTVVLFGDSHAAQWFPALLKVATARGWRIISRTKSACPAPSITVISRALG